MNRYRHRFACACPNNGVRVEYVLEVETAAMIMVEAIVDACKVDRAFHEDLADRLHVALGGRQSAGTGRDQGVDIETVRGGC